MTTPTPATTMLEQLGRLWAEKTAGTTVRTFCEPTSAAPANIYARPLPERAHRQATACSLTLSPTTPPEPNGSISSVGVVAHAVAPTPRAALELLHELRGIIRPNDRPYVRDNAAHGGSFSMRGVVGVPPFDVVYAGSTPLWRIVDIQIVSEAQPLQLGPGAGGHTGGQASAEMTFIVTGTQESMPKPTRAFDVWWTGAAPATVQITSTKLILTATTTVQITLATSGTIQSLHTNIPTLAPGWTRSQLVGSTSARQSTDLFPYAAISAVGSFQKQPLTVYA